MGLINEIKKASIILRGKRKSAKIKKETFFHMLSNINFINADCKTFKQPIIKDCESLMSICEENINSKSKSASGPYLQKIYKKARDLRDALSNFHSINPIALKTIHTAFEELSKACLNASGAKFALHMSARLNYTQTRGKLKELSNSILLAEKLFSETVLYAGTVSIYKDLKKIQLQIKNHNLLTKKDNFNHTIYIPMKKLGKYDKFSCQINLERFDTLAEQQNHIFSVVNSLCKALPNEHYLKEIYAEIEKINESLKPSQETIECSICASDVNPEDMVGLPCCGKSLCHECLNRLRKDSSSPSCPYCRKTIPKNLK